MTPTVTRAPRLSGGFDSLRLSCALITRRFPETSSDPRNASRRYPEGPIDPTEHSRRPLTGAPCRQRINLGHRLVPARRFCRSLEVGHGSDRLSPTLAGGVDESGLPSVDKTKEYLFRAIGHNTIDAIHATTPRVVRDALPAAGLELVRGACLDFPRSRPFALRLYHHFPRWEKRPDPPRASPP